MKVTENGTVGEVYVGHDGCMLSIFPAPESLLQYRLQ